MSVYGIMSEGRVEGAEPMPLGPFVVCCRARAAIASFPGERELCFRVPPSQYSSFVSVDNGGSGVCVIVLLPSLGDVVVYHARHAHLRHPVTPRLVCRYKLADRGPPRSRALSTGFGSGLVILR